MYTEQQVYDKYRTLKRYDFEEGSCEKYLDDIFWDGDFSADVHVVFEEENFILAATDNVFYYVNLDTNEIRRCTDNWEDAVNRTKRGIDKALFVSEEWLSTLAKMTEEGFIKKVKK